MQRFDYVSADTIQEVVGFLLSKDGSHPGSIRILAGGTDLLVQLRENRRQAELLIDVKNIPELTSITYEEQEGLRLGAAASCQQICSDRLVFENYPGLVDAIQLIGGMQIQYRASLGGNLCNASPAADSIPALIVHRAVCVVAGPAGTRSIPVEEFCVAPGKNALAAGEFLVAVNVPPPG